MDIEEEEVSEEEEDSEDEAGSEEEADSEEEEEEGSEEEEEVHQEEVVMGVQPGEVIISGEGEAQEVLIEEEEENKLLNYNKE